jgi:diguanylate cyclase (GGDEF)-like protein
MLSAMAWLTVDFTSGHTYSQVWMSHWNATVRFLFFMLVSYLIAAVKMHLQMEKLLARTDPLTGLKNLHSYREQVELLFRNASRYHYPITVGYIDLDGFKSVNDARGHAEGDRVLRAVSTVLPHVTREGDVCARLGGDEFGVVLANTDMPGAEVYFERLHERLLCAMKDGDWAVGFSIGVAVFREVLPAFDDAMKLADSLMYQVKQSGGNRVICRQFLGVEAHAPQANSPEAQNASYR